MALIHCSEIISFTPAMQLKTGEDAVSTEVRVFPEIGIGWLRVICFPTWLSGHGGRFARFDDSRSVRNWDVI
jgi:hypothetical protein